MPTPDKECEITVESDAPEDPNWAVWKMSLFTIGEMDVTGMQDMVDKIEAKKKEAGCCLKKLTIMGHGAPGYIEVGSDSINIWDTSTWKPILDQLKGNFCKGAEISLGGCSVGADRDGANLLSLIANNLGVKVNAPTHSINQYWSGPGEQVAEPGPPPEPIPDGLDSKPKKKQPKGKKKCLLFSHEGGPKTLELSCLKAFVILKPDEKPTRGVLRRYYNDSDLFQQFLDSLDIFDPISAVDMPFKVQAHVYFWLHGEDPATRPLTPPSYLVGGYRYLVFGGDWNHTYRLTGGMHEKIRDYGRYPSSSATLRKYRFLSTKRAKRERK